MREAEAGAWWKDKSSAVAETDEQFAVISHQPATWIFEPEDGGTKVTNVADYTVHLPVLRKLAESFLIRVNENEGEVLSANLKARMEA